MEQRSRLKWTPGSLTVIPAALLILFVLLRVKDGMSHWLYLIVGATYAAVALWEYLDYDKPRTLSLSYSLWSVWALAHFYSDHFFRHSSGADVLAWFGFAAAIAAAVVVFVGRPELYTK
ncbi:MAG TPA: hypothetical protein VGO46_02455 [Gemmatimonadaceae bacterium]|jgi:uncharacterized membrane protein|nr:hypothetical protein [Gemmatimonadaceae bacterium]